MSEPTDIHLDRAGEARLHEALRRCWHPVCRVSELEERPIPVTLLDEQLVVVRLGNDIACFPDLCVHRGTALSLGWVDDGSQPAPDGSGSVGEPCLVCAYHGWSYDRQGVVRRIPAVHGRSIPNRARVARYATAVAVGLVWVLLEPGPGGWENPNAAYPLPQADSWWEQPGFRTIPIPTYDWACSAARRVENFVDFSHFPWVHPGVLGDRSKPLSPEHEVIDDGVTISFDIALEEPQASVKGDAAPGVKVQRDPTTYTLHNGQGPRRLQACRRLQPLVLVRLHPEGRRLRQGPHGLRHEYQHGSLPEPRRLCLEQRQGHRQALQRRRHLASNLLVQQRKRRVQVLLGPIGWRLSPQEKHPDRARASAVGHEDRPRAVGRRSRRPIFGPHRRPPDDDAGHPRDGRLVHLRP